MNDKEYKIGEPFLDLLDQYVVEKLWNDTLVCRPIDEFEVGDMVVSFHGDAVRVEDWDDFWSSFPYWYEVAYMLSDNGGYTRREVGEMTIDQACEAFRAADPGAFENVFHTTVDEDDMEER